MMKEKIKPKLAPKGDSAAMAQMKKLFKHTRTGSYGTRDRYLKACSSFVRFLDEHYKLKNLRNLQDKHVIAYIEHRKSQEISDKTIKTDLGAIRYMHDLVPNVKYELSSNAELAKNHDVSLEKTKTIKGDRAWTEKEYEDMKGILNNQIPNSSSNTPLITRDIMILARSMGLRVSEAVAMRRSQAENALRTGVYQVLGEAKGGKHRKVPLSNESRQLLTERIINIPRGERVFASRGEKVHKVVNRIEKHLDRYRELITTSEGVSNRLDYKNDINSLTFHGLRYGYIQDRMNTLQEKGYSRDAAASIVTQEVGHERIEVIRIYTNGC